MKYLRKALILTTVSGALALTGVVATTGGERGRAVAPNVDCGAVAWPKIPAVCLRGGDHEQVRYITTNGPIVDSTMRQRFPAAFE